MVSKVDNPLQSNEHGAPNSSAISFDIGSEEMRTPSVSTDSRLRYFLYGWIHYLFDTFSTFFLNIKQFDFGLQQQKSYILISRAFVTLMKRGKLVWGSTFVALFFSLNFGWILGPSTDEAPSVSAVFAMGAVLLIMSNLQFVFFLFHNNEVIIQLFLIFLLPLFSFFFFLLLLLLLLTTSV